MLRRLVMGAVLLATSAPPLAAQAGAGGPKPAASPGGPLPGRIVDVEAGTWYFHAPDTIPAGLTTFRLKIVDEDEHRLWIVRLDPGKTKKDYLAAEKAGRPLPWAHHLGGPGDPGAKRTSNATMVLVPGHYLMVCFVRDRVGIEHLQKGMVKEFTVSRSTAPAAAEPAADLVVNMVDFDFKLSTTGPLKRGRYTVRVENTGKYWHEWNVLKLQPGKTLKDALAWTETRSGAASGPSPVEPFGGLASFPPGQHLVTTVGFTPGRYIFYCILTEGTADKRPHYNHGMLVEVEVR
jgi:hypothetical protein